MARNRRRGFTNREREKHEQSLTDQRRAKGLLTEPTDKAREDSSDGADIFSDDGALLAPAPVKDGKRFCPQCITWRGTENFGPTHTTICWWCVRHPETPPAERRAGVTFPPGFWGRP